MLLLSRKLIPHDPRAAIVQKRFGGKKAVAPRSQQGEARVCTEISIIDSLTMNREWNRR
jgi:hypothetical protein